MPFLQLSTIHARFAPKKIPRGTSRTLRKAALPQMSSERAEIQSAMVQRVPSRLDEKPPDA